MINDGNLSSHFYCIQLHMVKIYKPEETLDFIYGENKDEGCEKCAFVVKK